MEWLKKLYEMGTIWEGEEGQDVRNLLVFKDRPFEEFYPWTDLEGWTVSKNSAVETRTTHQMVEIDQRYPKNQLTFRRWEQGLWSCLLCDRHLRRK